MKVHRTLAAAASTATTLVFVSSVAAQPSFIGVNFTASSLLSDSNFIPPDTMGAAGVDHLVELINGRYSVFHKSTGARVQTSTLNSFWTSAGAAPTANSFDPRVLYDPHTRRWFAASVDNGGGANSFLLGISSGSNPTSGWASAKIDADGDDSHWADFPMLGMNGDTVALSANMFQIGGGSVRTGFVAIPKADLVQPAPSIANAVRFEDVTGTGNTPQLSVDLDNTTAPLPIMVSLIESGTVKRSNLGFGGGNSPALTTFGGFYSIDPAGTAPSANQPGFKQNIDVGDSRFQANAVVNNGEIWSVASVNSNGRAAIRWLRLNASDTSVIEQGTIDDPSLYLMRPSIAVNDLGDVVIGFSATSPAVFASTYYVAGRTVGDVTSFSPIVQSHAGSADYQRLDSIGRNRWGDYSATTVDPADPSIFWTTQEFASATDIWSNRVTEVILPQSDEARWKLAADGDLGAAGNWLDGSAPAAGSHVIFSRSSEPGSYTVNADSSQAIDRLSVRQGNVALQLNGTSITATSASAALPSVMVGEFGGSPRLLLGGGGTLNSVNAQIAPNSISIGTLSLNSAAWNNSGGVYIGGTDASAGGAGTLEIAGASRVTVGGITKVWPGGTVRYSGGAFSTASLDIPGGKLLLDAGGNKLVQTQAAFVTGGGMIDLADNDMIVDYSSTSPSASIRALILSGRNGGGWNGTGIASSSAAASPLSTSLGHGEASLLGITSFDGVSVDATAVLIKYTYLGDATLDGKVDVGDLGRLATSWQQPGEWIDGDFDYSGVVNVADLGALATNWQQGVVNPPPLGPSFVEALASLGLPLASIPEPSLTASLASLACSLRRTRKRRVVDGGRYK